MSQFIQNTNYIQTQPIISVPIKQVVIQKCPHQKLKSLNSNASIDFIKKYCIKLQQKQYNNLIDQNQFNIQRKNKELKKKIFKNINQSVVKIFQTKEVQKLNIRKVQKMQSKKIQIQKKYSNQILHKVQAFKQAQQVNKMKSLYTTWYDSTQNDRGKSPIIKKTVYLLQRAHKQNILQALNLRNSHKFKRQSVATHNKVTSVSVSECLQKHSSSHQIQYKKRKLRWAKNKSELQF